MSCWAIVSMYIKLSGKNSQERHISQFRIVLPPILPPPRHQLELSHLITLSVFKQTNKKTVVISQTKYFNNYFLNLQFFFHLVVPSWARWWSLPKSSRPNCFFFLITLPVKSLDLLMQVSFIFLNFWTSDRWVGRYFIYPLRAILWRSQVDFRRQ